MGLRGQSEGILGEEGRNIGQWKPVRLRGIGVGVREVWEKEAGPPTEAGAGTGDYPRGSRSWQKPGTHKEPTKSVSGGGEGRRCQGEDRGSPFPHKALNTTTITCMASRTGQHPWDKDKG